MSLKNKVLWQSSYGLTYPDHDDSFELTISGFYKGVITASASDIDKEFNTAIEAFDWLDTFLLDKEIECDSDFDFILDGLD